LVSKPCQTDYVQKRQLIYFDNLYADIEKQVSKLQDNKNNVEIA